MTCHASPDELVEPTSVSSSPGLLIPSCPVPVFYAALCCGMRIASSATCWWSDEVRRLVLES